MNIKNDIQVKLWVVPFIALSIISAITGGWQRIGWALPINAAAAHHGAVMVGCFLSSVIMIERVVVHSNKWMFLIPIINASGIVFFLAGKPVIAETILVCGSIGFLGICINLYRSHRENYHAIFIVSAACLLAGNLVLLKTQVYASAIAYWMEFFLLLITTERLELARFLNIKRQTINWLLCFLSVTLAGMLVPFHYYGSQLMAAGIIMTATWLLMNDRAAKSIKKQGQHKYSAVLLITGYIWLLLTGFFMMIGNINSYWYDVVIHSFFLGFIFSMVFSHAPIILPGIIKLPLKLYRPVLYIWFGFLQLSLISRLCADLCAVYNLRMFSGLLNGLAILGFFFSILIIAAREKKNYRNMLKSRINRPGALSKEITQ